MPRFTPALNSPSTPATGRYRPITTSVLTSIPRNDGRQYRSKAKSCSNSVNPLSLKIKSANRYPSSTERIPIPAPTNTMFIVEHARNTRYRSHRIAGDTVPGTARPVLLMKHRSCHKSRSRMPRRKRLVVRSVGAGHTAGIFQRVDRSGHQRDGKGIRHQHPAPRTAPPDSSDFQPQHQRCGSILQIIVIMETERRYIIVPQMTKSPIPLLHDQTCDNKGNSDIGYSIGTRRGYPLHIPDKRAAAEGGGNRTQCIDLGESADRHPQQKAQQQQFLHLPNTRFRPHRKNLFSPLTDSRDGDGCGGGYSARHRPE